jgi:hypothetical protein
MYISQMGWLIVMIGWLTLLWPVGPGRKTVWSAPAAHDRERVRRDSIATVNGYRLCYVQDSRFGRFVSLDGTSKAFATIDDAIAFAKKRRRGRGTLRGRAA